MNVMLEGVMLWLYLRPPHLNNRERWGIAFLYSYSPIAVYWLDILGYNGGIIQFGTFVALWLSERRKPYWSGFVAGLSFTATKLLAILGWPAVIWYDRLGWRQRALPLLLTVVGTAMLLLAGVDVLIPLKLEFAKSTSGNVWYLAGMVQPWLRDTSIFRYGHLVLFALILLPALIEYWKERGTCHANDSDVRFSRASAFAGFTNLLFLVCSRKAYTFYLPMCFFLILYSALRGGEHKHGTLVAVTLLGATTTLEGSLADSLYLASGGVRDVSLRLPQAQVLFAVDIIIVAAYIYLMYRCRRRYLSWS